MSRKSIFLSLSAFALAACATTGPFTEPSETKWDELSQFKSERQFEHYYRTVTNQLEEEEGEDGDTPWYGTVPPPPPPPMSVPPPPPPLPPGAAPAPVEEPILESIVVTGTKIADDANPSITNTQEAGVDEGDIVKQIGQYLIVMQDGRLFSIDLLPDGEPGLRYVDRQNVYTTTEEDTWYDEMLVFGRQMIVIGYSYDAEASVFAVLDLEEDGQITFRDRFFLPAQDYFDGDNYTTRLVDGQLALHTSFYLSEVDSFEDLTAPVLSRSMAPSETPRLKAKDVYRPLQKASDPLLHTITICPLRDLKESDAPVPQCRTTAFIAGDSYEYYASQDSVWLWVNKESYRWWISDEDETEDESTALLYRIPYVGAPGAAKVQGEPVNQFSLAAGADMFRAFVEVDLGDEAEDEASPYRLMQLPLSRVNKRPGEVDNADYVPLPNIEGWPIENRFTGTHFIYTTQNETWSQWRPSGEDVTAKLTFVPLADPSVPLTLDVPHSVIRLERARDHIVATGYRNEQGLSLTSFDLRGDHPRLAGRTTLVSRFESENRSHAFNSAISADGSGLIGLPTVLQRWESGRRVWRSDSSDISYIRVAEDASLRPIGALQGAKGEPHESYECEVSCIDWYGNSRPIFTLGRVFALSGTSLVEGRVGDNNVSEIRRVDLTEPLVH